MGAAVVVPNVNYRPRWRYAMFLNIGKGELNPIPDAGGGAYSGLGGIFSDAASIFAGNNLYAESIIYSRRRPGFARLR